MPNQLLQRKSVSHLELFFDLVFVFAFTEVTFYLSQDLTWLGMVRTVLLLSTLWLSWQSYAWLGTIIDINDRLTKISLFVVMFVMVISGLAVPFAFATGAILFCSANLFIRMFQVFLFIISKDKNLQEKKGYLELLPTALLGSSIILTGAISGYGHLEIWWAISVILEYSAMFFLMDLKKWSVAAAHFAERHALIIIIALGEAIISIGIGIEGLPLDFDVIMPIVLGLVVIIALWWTYFDKNMSIVEKHVVGLPDVKKTAFAQRAYTYLHLPMIIGLIFFSLGVKKSVGHPHDVLSVVANSALCGGLMLNLTAQILFLNMATKKIGYIRLTAVFSLAALLFVSSGLESLVVLMLCSGIMVALVIIEAFLPESASYSSKDLS